MIEAYLDTLSSALSFDRSLARRVRGELADHLHEALASEPSDDRGAAERIVVARCGDPLRIAREFAATALARQTSRLAVGLILAIAAVLLSMRGHLAWYFAMGWEIPRDMRNLAALLGAVTRGTFAAAIVLGIVSAIYGYWRRSQVRLAQIAAFSAVKRFHRLSAAATIALTVSVVGDAALAQMRLNPVDASWAIVVPVGSIVFELACAVALVMLIRASGRYADAAEALSRA